MKYNTRLFLFTLIGILSTGHLAAQPLSTGFAVVELFTSQGDINSPPADQLLTEIIAEAGKNNQSVYGISFHVDFWNRFGWKDPFSKLQYTHRLNNYATVFREKETYTPRFLVNGKPLTGNVDKKNLSETIRKELNTHPVFGTEITYEIFADTLDITYKLALQGKSLPRFTDYYISVVITEAAMNTKVTQGDNAGKTLRNERVARLLFTTNLAAQNGLLRVPLKGQKPAAGKSLLVFIQAKKSRKITGAALLPFHGR